MTNCAYLITDGTGHFDFLKWQNDVKLWFKNKEAIGFECIFKIEKGKFVLEFENTEEKYKKELSRVTQKIIGGALYWITTTYNQYSPLEEDKESELKRKNTELAVKTKFYIDTFLKLGIEQFLNTLEMYSNDFKFQYELSKLTVEDNTLYDYEGYALVDNHWEKEENGQKLMKPISENMEKFLASRKKTA